jgi:predicted DNA-binding transcriptional regulator YafY
MAKDGVRDKTAERQINLVMLLQSSRFGFTKEQICDRIEGYEDPQSEAFNRKFERDKVELLAAGIDIEVFQPDALDLNDFRYRVTKKSALLPDVTLTPSEVLVLNLATLAWKDSVHESDARDLRHKLDTLGVYESTDAPMVQISVARDLEPLINAISQHKRVKFDYRKPRESSTETREIEPWGLALRKGSWYLYGYDRHRKAERVFNIARVTSEFASVGGANAFSVPDDLDVESLISPAEISASQIQVKLKIDAGKGMYWRDHALEIVEGTGNLEDPVTVTTTLTLPSLQVPQLAADAPGVVVVGPQQIRDQVAKLIRGALYG